jgi:hypothetical protein
MSSPKGGSKNPWGDCSTERGVQAAFEAFLHAVFMASNGGPVDPRLFVVPQAAGRAKPGTSSRRRKAAGR